MPPKTKAGTEKFLLGQPDSVLNNDFLHAVQEGKDYSSILPWLGSPQLPTIKQVLCLYYYLREESGRKNSFVSRAQIKSLVANLAVK